MFNLYLQLGRQSGSCLDRRYGCSSPLVAAPRSSFPASLHCRSLSSIGCYSGCQGSCLSAVCSPAGFTPGPRLFSATGISTNSITRTWTSLSSSVSRLALRSRSTRCAQASGAAASSAGALLQYTWRCSRHHFGIFAGGMSLGVTQANKAPAPNRPRFPLGGLEEFECHVCAPPSSSAAVGEARRSATLSMTYALQ
jgi:hypothetical protein